MINIAKTLSTSINNAGERIAKVLRLGKKDVQQIHVVAPFGDDSNPPKDVRAIYQETGIKGQAVLVGYINTNQSANEGERRLFSVDPSTGEEKTYIHLKNDGVVELNGDSDHVVGYSQTQKSIDEIKNDINDLKQIFASWVVVPNDGGAKLKSDLATYYATPLTEDIANGKKDTLKTP